jgi:hypothetical protein
MQYFQALGATAPRFSIGDRVIATIIDPDEGTFHDPATVAGMVWLGSRWEYFLLFDGYDYSTCDWSSEEISLMAETENHPGCNCRTTDSPVGLVSAVTTGR